MSRSSLFIIVLSLASAGWLCAVEPIGFPELSLLVRTGESPQSIVNEATRRKLLQALTPEQEANLRANGASALLLNALRAPELLAAPDAVTAYRAHHPSPPPTLTAPASPTPSPQAMALPDRFAGGLEAAKSTPDRAVQASEAFSLSQLPAAIAKARQERKPLGFIMLWGQMLDAPGSTRNRGGNSALLHFCEAFKNSLVLVFVRHENELPKVPRAVSAGYGSPDEGGFAPNMAVVDASARELIVEIPCGGAKGAGPDRDAIFQTAAARIQQWLTLHPSALANPETSGTAP